MATRGVAGSLLSLLVAGCSWVSVAPLGQPDAGVDAAAPVPGAGFGPVLVLDVVNNSDREVVAGYEYVSDNPAGSGEAVVPACHQVSTFMAEIVGRYRILVDGAVVADGAVPRAMTDGAVTMRVIVDPDGTAHAVGGLRWSDAVPDDFARPVNDCP
ncbi:MAG TPA: hypothetical protein VHR55_00045 [Candidatus Limnocylindria bacterium]|nr:hypothetical protein [Candidatus Limnocylindria bacterium]